jgi:ferredoxin-NADP reductase/ferredoxin/truncated hemoglobin YjbI
MVKIVFEGARYRAEPGESVLDALIRGGANLAFSCRKGSCHTCLLQCVAGDPGADATRGLRKGLADEGMFLPCRSLPSSDIEVQRPDVRRMSVAAQVADRTWLSPSIACLSLEPETTMPWRPGQFVNLRRPDGVVRSYSIASIAEEDYFLQIHVKRIEGGAMSPWLLDEVAIGDRLDVQGPLGHCYYDPAFRDRNLLLLATGSGLSPVLAVCRDALRQGHTGKIVLYHGSRNADGLYSREMLDALARAHPSFSHHACLTAGPTPQGVTRGRIVPRAFSEHDDLEGWVVFACGVPPMVYEARIHAVRSGVRRSDIRADPFEYSHGHVPDDAAVIAAIPPHPELWAALEHGAGLRRILEAFYDATYRDPRLSPFFGRVTKDRAIGQQYAFLSDLMSGERRYFGLRPFNAHHWMVISDELFDYREALFERFMRDDGLPEPFVRQWAAIHETFRSVIVKGSARGMFIDGQERSLAAPEDIVVDCPTVCDGCQEGMNLGDRGRFNSRTGQLFCVGCGAEPTARATHVDVD